jgi:hypothetical protein
MILNSQREDAGKYIANIRNWLSPNHELTLLHELGNMLPCVVDLTQETFCILDLSIGVWISEVCWEHGLVT